MTKNRLTTVVACAVTLLGANTQVSRAAQTVEGCTHLGGGHYVCQFGAGTISCTLESVDEFCQLYAQEYGLIFEGSHCIQGGTGGAGCNFALP